MLAQSGSEPTVRVLGAPTQLAFSTPPPTELIAGDLFSTTVDVLDEDGQLTDSDAQVSLAAEGLRGTKVVDAVNGRATAGNLMLVRAGSVVVTASSPGLASATAQVTVRPGPPARTEVRAPVCSSSAPDCGISGDVVPAGGQFAAGVSILDRFGNLVDTPQSVTVTRAATDSEPAASVTTGSLDGTVEVVLSAPTSIGTYHYTVTSGSLAPVTFDATVEAGPAVALTIDAVTPQGDVGVLAKDQPFNVTLTARDAFGNPAKFSGDVTLASSGGIGPALGTLAAAHATFQGGSTATATGLVYDGYGNGITLTAQSPTLIDGTRFVNVNLFATAKHASPGESLTVSLGNCTDATPAVPVCTSLVLPNGAVGTVTVAQGECDPFTPCRRGSVNEALLFDGLADLTDGTRALYSRKDPAMIVLRCDKTLCGGAGTGAFPLLFQETGWDATHFEVAPPCPAKGRIGAGQTFCQDYRRNKRDNAGDLIAHCCSSTTPRQLSGRSSAANEPGGIGGRRLQAFIASVPSRRRASAVGSPSRAATSPDRSSRMRPRGGMQATAGQARCRTRPVQHRRRPQ